MSTAALCKGKQSRSVLRLRSGHPCIIPLVSGSASSSSLASLFLCMDSAVEATVPSAQGLLKLRLGALKDTSGGRSGNTSFEPLSPKGWLVTSDNEAKFRVAERTENRPPTDFHAVSPPASTYVINNPRTPHTALLSHSLHFPPWTQGALAVKVR